MPSVVCAPICDDALIEVRNLDVRILVDSVRNLSALDGISLRIAPGEIVGLMGESGAGKTTLALALLRLLPPLTRVTAGTVLFESRPLLSLRESELRKIRGAKISLIYQDSSVLNPVVRVGDQVAEVLRAHRAWTWPRCRAEARLLLQEMELEDVDRIYAAYPHQLSGGQRQRIVIAQALACRPALVIADEPTASLDPDTSTAIIDLLGRLALRHQTAFLIISHDLGVLARLAGRIMVMYAGRIVEQGPSRQILCEPLHPYTQALVSCILPETPATGSGHERSLFPTIAGSSADSPRGSSHCDFESRCRHRMQICSENIPKPVSATPAHQVSCFKIGGA
jgi:oligopeptide/dipeptide ABC transporter ATP-binding protein